MIYFGCFHSQHSGNIYIKAVVSNITSNNIQIQDLLYAPLLTGSESIEYINSTGSVTPSVRNNTLTEGCGYLSKGWDNTIDWECTFDYYSTGRWNGALLVLPDTTERDDFIFQIWDSNFITIKDINNNRVSQKTDAYFEYNIWHTIKIIKQNNTISIYINNNIQLTATSNNFDSDKICIGLDKGTESQYSTIKNIKVKSL